MSYIVGIGASAGGLDPLEKFFNSMPQDISNIAFVVVQHLSPDYKSLMGELLARHTSMEIKKVEDNMPVEMGCIYLIPPKKNMTIVNSTLHLADINNRNALNLPIDVFFKSLADDQGEKSIGIILSGTGSDGTNGIRAIKEAGGLTECPGVLS
jgi:two-component system, chemotaxis family, CheB/CheR fusion protein